MELRGWAGGAWAVDEGPAGGLQGLTAQETILTTESPGLAQFGFLRVLGGNEIPWYLEQGWRIGVVRSPASRSAGARPASGQRGAGTRVSLSPRLTPVSSCSSSVSTAAGRP